MKTLILTCGLICATTAISANEVRIDASVTSVVPRIKELSGNTAARPGSATLSTSAPVLSSRIPAKGPVALHIGPPLIQTKGLVAGKDVLYVADTGKDAKHNEPARIWKFDLRSSTLSKLYEGPLLINAKWIFYRSVKTPGMLGELYVADYGVEPNARTPGTGEGAKVFVIPIDGAGDAMEPRVLHDGPPFRSPEGITVVGETVIVADWAAGPTTTLGDRPGQFNRGQLFALPTSGGTPTLLFQSQVFVTLIGVSHYSGEDGHQYLRLIDIDGGRPHTEAAFLPQSGLPAHYRARILSTRPLALGNLQRIEMQEEIDIPLTVEGLKPDEQVEFELHDTARTTSNARTLRMTAAQLSGLTPQLKLVTSDLDPFVRATMRVRKGQTVRYEKFLDVPKGVLVGRAMDPKETHVPEPDFPELARAGVTPDGTSAGLYLSPADGGVPTALWRGAPFAQPMGARYSADGSRVYVSDQSAGPNGTAAIFAVELPSKSARLALYPRLKLQKQPVPLK